MMVGEKVHIQQPTQCLSCCCSSNGNQYKHCEQGRTSNIKMELRIKKKKKKKQCFSWTLMTNTEKIQRNNIRLKIANEQHSPIHWNWNKEEKAYLNFDSKITSVGWNWQCFFSCAGYVRNRFSSRSFFRHRIEMVGKMGERFWIESEIWHM